MKDIKIYDKVEELLNSRDFYELMQLYRHSPISNQELTTESFEAVKEFILNGVKDV